VDFNLGSFAFFLGVARASDKNIHNYFYVLYFVYGTTACRSQNNRITWQKRQPAFSFRIALSVIMTIRKVLSMVMTITVLLRLATHEFVT